MPRLRIRKCFHCLVLSSGALAILLVWGVQDTNQKDGQMFPQESHRLWSKPLKERKDGESYSRFVKHNKFTKMKYGPMYLFGVTLGNSTDSAHWDIIKIRGSMGKIYVNETNFSCCLQYTKASGKFYLQQSVKAFNIRHKPEALSAPHFTCQNPIPGVVPDGVALTLNNYTCSEDHVTYRKPETPLREPGEKLAICTKLAYGKRDAELIIEFMEVYKYLGVDKFVTYFLKDLNEDSRKVLEYYASTGIVDLYLFQQAEADTLKRKWDLPDKQSNSDKQLLIFDAFERMSGYTYFGIIDHDEFLIPSKDRDLKQLLSDLYAENEKAAGFRFKSLHYCMNKGRHGTINDLILGQYITTSTKDPEYFAPKNIYKPIFMSPGHIHTHHPEAANTSAAKMVKIDKNEVYIRHFRSCRARVGVHFPLDSLLINDTWVAEGQSVYKLIMGVGSNEGYIRHYRNCHPEDGTHFPMDSELINDTGVADWSRRIQANAEEVRFRVFEDYKWSKN